MVDRRKPERAPTTPLTKFALGLCLLAVPLWVFLRAISDGGSPPRCPPVDEALIARLLDADKAEALPDMLDKARRLSAGGQCVIEGGWSKSDRRFYFAVYDLGSTYKRPYFQRFTRDALRR